MKTRPLYWSVRREIWENRSLYVVPLVAAGAVLFSFTVRALSRAARLGYVDPAQHGAYSIAASVIIMTSYVVGAFYCLDALYGERRDRSLLFWKSLPVSDRTTVLSKAAIPLVVMPAIAFVVSLATQLVMLAQSLAMMPVWRAGTRWGAPLLLEMTPVMLYGIVVHALWHAPLYAWLLLVSAWARRAPFLFVVMPFVLLAVVERIVFQTAHVRAFVRHRLIGSIGRAFSTQADGQLGVSLEDPLRFVTTPGLWGGLAAAALFLAVAVRLRRRSEPI